MTNGGDAAEQVVRLSLEGFEVAAKLSGAAAKNIAVLLVSVLKQEQKTKGKARLTNMIKSGKELKVFSIPNKDLKKFTEQAKRYGVLYCVLRDKNTKGDNVPIDIIARAEDASKIQRIVERFELGKVDKAAIVTESQKAVEKREALEKDKPTKTKNEKRDVGDSVAVAQCVAQELGHAQLSINSDSYSRADMGFQAVCIGYMLCKKYGVDTQNFAINRIPEKLAGKEPKDIRYELSKTRNAMADIHSRVSDELYKKKQERSKDYER